MGESNPVQFIYIKVHVIFFDSTLTYLITINHVDNFTVLNLSGVNANEMLPRLRLDIAFSNSEEEEILMII